MKNKKADIAITILVLGVIALCAAALFSFYNEKNQIKGVVNSAYFLQDIYNLAESVKFSGVGLIDKYDKELQEYDIQYDSEKQELIIGRTYYKKDLGVSGNEEILKITYNSAP